MSEVENWIAQDVLDTLGLSAGAGAVDLAGSIGQVKTVALWNLRARARERMVDALIERGLPAGDSDALWIGWAGGVSAQTRPGLLFQDLARLERLLDDPVNAVRMVFAGRPRDSEGQRLFSILEELADGPRFGSRILLLPDESPAALKVLIQGVDLWLTTAIPGSDAGGYGSGALANGALSLSTGGPEGSAAGPSDTGWTTGGQTFEDQSGQDEYDARMLFGLLEDDIVPLFYDWSRAAVPERWIERIRAAVVSLPG